MTTPEEQRRRIAWHEAGHVLAARAVGFDPTEATIEGVIPGTAGHARADTGDIPFRERLIATTGDHVVPLLDLPWETRQHLERRIIVDLAGQLAEELAVRVPTSGYDDPDPSCVVRAELLVLEAGPVVTASLLEHEASFPSSLETDTAHAQGLAAFATDDDLGAASGLLTMLRATARRLVARHAAEIAALADQLLAHGSVRLGHRAEVITPERGAEAAAIIDDTGTLPAS